MFFHRQFIHHLTLITNSYSMCLALHCCQQPVVITLAASKSATFFIEEHAWHKNHINTLQFLLAYRLPRRLKHMERPFAQILVAVIAAHLQIITYHTWQIQSQTLRLPTGIEQPEVGLIGKREENEHRKPEAFELTIDN